MIKEKVIHDLIENNNNIQEDLCNILNIDKKEFGLIHEVKYINGISADFTVLQNNNARAIIECKGENIGVTDYVRGIGQVLQYEYFRDKKIVSKHGGYCDIFNTLLIVPSLFFNKNHINVSRFKYPSTTKIIQIDTNNNNLIEFTVNELNKFTEVDNNNLISISPIYIRDNRIFEIYILLKTLNKSFNDRKKIENDLMKRFEVVNNNNWRNAFISLSTLGLISSKNTRTRLGESLSRLEYHEFVKVIYEKNIKIYVDIIMEIVSKEPNLTNSDINKRIRSVYDNKDVLFLTQSDGRYISSWLNILRDDFGCLEFESRQRNRKIKYIPKNVKNLSEYIYNYTRKNILVKRYK